MISPKIFVLGEAMIDAYHIGTSTRQSPEAPVPVTTVTEELFLPGGAANVATKLQQFGAYSTLCSPKGTVPTKNRLMLDGTQIARWDTNDQCQEFELEELARIHRGYDAVVVSDYGKGAFTPRVKAELGQQLVQFPGQIFIDTKDPTGWPTTAIFFPNQKEWDAAVQVYNRLPHVIKTLGSQGMEYLYYGQRKHFEPAQAKQVKSVIGAGDCVIAAYAYKAALGGTPQECLAFAAQKAGEKVERPYTL